VDQLGFEHTTCQSQVQRPTASLTRNTAILHRSPGTLSFPCLYVKVMDNSPEDVMLPTLLFGPTNSQCLLTLGRLSSLRSPQFDKGHINTIHSIVNLYHFVCLVIWLNICTLHVILLPNKFPLLRNKKTVKEAKTKFQYLPIICNCWSCQAGNNLANSATQIEFNRFTHDWYATEPISLSRSHYLNILIWCKRDYSGCNAPMKTDVKNSHLKMTVSQLPIVPCCNMH